MNYYGGLCLDGKDSIPEEYKDLLYIGENVIIKTGTVLAGDGFGYHFPSMEHKEHRHGVQIHDSVHSSFPCYNVSATLWARTIRSRFCLVNP